MARPNHYENRIERCALRILYSELAMECQVPECKQRQPTELGRKLKRIRPWVQTGFLGLWLAPLGPWLHGIPGCVFHCYSCPLSSFACTIGVAANYAALVFILMPAPRLAGSEMVIVAPFPP